MSFLELIKHGISRPANKTPETRGVEIVLMDELNNEGCPVCASLASHDRRWFSWFSIETYHEPAFLEQIEKSLGFCARHGAYLDQQANWGSQLTSVHGTLSYYAHKQLTTALFDTQGQYASMFPDPDICPVCKSYDESMRRTLWFFSKLLEEGDALEKYGHPGMLCFPHLQMLARDIAPAVLNRLISLHEKTMSVASHEMGTLRFSGMTPVMKQDAVRAALYFSVGQEHREADQILLSRIYTGHLTRDPVPHFIDSLGKNESCPVCLEAYRSLSEWIDWLDDNIGPADDLDPVIDLLPTCPEHVHACIRLGRSPLQFAAIYASLRSGLQKTATAVEQLRRLEKRKKRTIREKFGKCRKNSDITEKDGPRKAILSPVRCPVCGRLEIARGRAIDLLVALLEESRFRTDYECGHGLCPRHLVETLRRKPSPDISAFLVRVESAKLARLDWELRENMRKMAWDTRPESRGSEQTAWHRALARFSGLPMDKGR